MILDHALHRGEDDQDRDDHQEGDDQRCESDRPQNRALDHHKLGEEAETEWRLLLAIAARGADEHGFPIPDLGEA